MLPDRDLDRELRDLGSRLEYPPVPDLARSVRSRLEAEADGPGSSPRLRPQLLWIAAAALVLLVAVPVFSLAVRDTGGVFSGAGGAVGGAADGGAGSGEQAAGERPVAANEPRTAPVLESQEEDAPAGASSSAGAMAIEDGAGAGPGEGGASGESLRLGEKILLREARARAQVPILLPGSPKLAEPDEIYARKSYSEFVFVYRARPGLPALEDTYMGLILTQESGEIGAAYLPGGTVRGAGLETVSIGGEEGYWVPPSGDSPGVARSGGLLAGVLLWERDGQALRLEADVPKKEAVRIAESVR
jgi:hypothetical protein